MTTTHTSRDLVNKINGASLEKGPYEFRYFFSIEWKIGFIVVSLLFLGGFISAFIDSFVVPDNRLNFDLIIFTLPMTISSLIIYCQYKPSRFAILGDYIEGPRSFLSPFKNVRIDFKEIESFKIGRDYHQTFLFIRSNKQKISISFDFLNETEQDCVLQILNIELNHLNSSALVLAELKSRILWKRSRKAETTSLSVLVLTCLAAMLILSGLSQYNLRQPSSSLLMSISIMISIGMAVFLNKRYAIKEKNNQTYKSFAVFFIISFMAFSPILSFINQIFDSSSLDRRIASVVMDPDESKRRDDKCYYVNDELIKDEESLKICTKENPTLDETNIVEIHFKEGNLGQRWVASMQIIDANGDKPIRVSR